jgi:hypothetical protein
MYNDESALLAFFASFFLFFLAIAIIVIIAQWKIYEKAGQPGWACIIPIYNVYILLKIVGKPGWWLLLLIIPFVNFVILIWVTNLLAKSFGKSEGFTLGLLFLSFIFYPILGFGKDEYQGPVGDPDAFQAFQDAKYQFETKA